MTSAELGRYLFVAGTIPLGVAGLGHAAVTVLDVRRPRVFTPVHDVVRRSMTTTGMRLAPWRTNMWRAWLGFNISHGIGIAAFFLMLSLVAVHDFRLVRQLAFPIPMAATVAAVYTVLGWRFWFYAPAILAGTSMTLFITSAIVLWSA